MSTFHSGFVGIIGSPNAGKSTLVNALTGEDISIVTPKPQTTRKRITGILSNEKFQAILVDAPGFIGAESGLNGFLKDEALAVQAEVDALIYVVSLDVENLKEFELQIKKLASLNKPVTVFLNKIDLSEPSFLKQCIDLLEVVGLGYFVGSATKNPKQIVQKLLQWMGGALPETGAPLYDPELMTTQTLRELSEEIIREAAFLLLHQEVPFGLGVKTLKFDESKKGLVKIYAELWVNRDAHKRIVVGKQASNIKAIGTQARKKIEKLLGEKVFLDLHVKIKKNWIKNQGLLEELGYVIQS